MILKGDGTANLRNQEADRPPTKQDRPLRILMILHMPWDRELGAPRVSLETAEELQRLGHTVDKFDINDAFPIQSKLSSFFQSALFPFRAAQYVRQYGHRYDVIQAEQGNLPCTKKQLKYSGFLMARSNGLAHFYDQYARDIERKRRSLRQRQGSTSGNALRWLAKRLDGGLPRIERSFDAADAIILINQDECEYVSCRLSHPSKAFLLPNGLSEDRFVLFASHRTAPAERLANQQVVFVGHWSERKGADDLPMLVQAVRRQLPEARFLFLGTGSTSERIQLCFEPGDRDAVEVVPFFHSRDLPALLSKATVGILPSYIEGFGIGVLEQLAAGIPSVAYDVPGPREMLKHFSQPMLTPVGDVGAFAMRLTELLRLPISEYAALQSEALEIAGRFRWRETAARWLEIYNGRK